MNFIWCVTLGIALSCVSGESFGMFGKSTEKVLFEAITNGDDTQAINAIEASSKILMKKYATNLAQTANLEINRPVEITRLNNKKVLVKNFENTTPLILAVLLGRSTIIDRLIQEFELNKRSIGHEVQAILSGMDQKKNTKSLKASAIDGALLLGNNELVEKFIAKKIGSDADIRVARAWMHGIKTGTQSGSATGKAELENKLETLQESLAKLKEKLNQLRKSLQLLKGGLTI